MKRALIGIVGLSLAACGVVEGEQWDFAQVQTSFIACMNASAAPKTYYGFSQKIDDCRSAAFRSESSRHES